MQGSDKQVEWANKIKAVAMAEARQWLTEMERAAAKAGKGEMAQAVAARTLKIVDAQQDAKWWIETVRGVTVRVWIAGAYTQAVREVTA